MVLANPKIPYRSIRDAYLTVLRNGKAVLNSGMKNGNFTQVSEQIRAGDITIFPDKNALFPTILIKLIRKEEDFTNLGNYGRKRPKIYFQLYGLVLNDLTSKEQDNDIMQLTSNIEGIFRDNIPVDATLLLWSQIKTVEFGTTEVFENKYIDIVSMQIEAVCQVE